MLSLLWYTITTHGAIDTSSNNCTSSNITTGSTVHVLLHFAKKVNLCSNHQKVTLINAQLFIHTKTQCNYITHIITQLKLMEKQIMMTNTNSMSVIIPPSLSNLRKRGGHSSNGGIRYSNFGFMRLPSLLSSLQ